MANKTVWILGAGFSVSLGGPLLVDLFSERMRRELDASYNVRVDEGDPVTWLAYHLYHWGTGKRHTVGTPRSAGEDTLNGPRLWRDAEEYLDRLDQDYSPARSDVLVRALEELGQARYSKGVHGPAQFLKSNAPEVILRDVSLVAKRWMAAECSVFVANADPRTERWEPYRDWAESLTPDDSVITFNYDRVLEVLGDTLRVDGRQVRYRVLLPDAKVPHNHAPVLKLHGSVDWRREATGVFEKADPSDFARHASRDEMAIATPGSHKQSLVKELEPLWALAEQKLAEASLVVFVGYRFPETDAESRRRLIHAMNQGATTPSYTVRTVLGPNTNSPDSNRLRGLLLSVKDKSVSAVPMWAEDYLTVAAMERST